MYARLTRYRCDPSRLEELTAKVDGTRAKLREISGIVDVYSVWRADGNAITMAIYESESAAEAAVDQVKAVWGDFAGLLVGGLEVEIYDNVEHLAG